MKRLLGTASAGLIALTAYGTVAGFLGSLWWIFDLAAHFRVQLAALAGVATLGLVVLGRKNWAIIGAVTVLANLAVIVPLYVRSPAAPITGDSLRIVTLNVQAGNPAKVQVIDYLRSIEADVIFLHESSVDWEAEIHAADLPYQLTVSRGPGFSFGTVALTKPGYAVEIVRLGQSRRRSVVVDVTISGIAIRVLGTHPIAPTSSERAALRDDQLNAVGVWSAAQARPVVVAGDFNTTSWSNAFRQLEAEDLVNSQNGFGVQATWPVPATVLRIPIDHVLHSPALATIRRELGPDVGSDHFPLEVDIGLAGSG